MLSMTDPESIIVGMDVSKSTIALGVLFPGTDVPAVQRLTHEEVSLRRFLAKFPDLSRLRTCYEAGPTGFRLYRFLAEMGVSCEVVAPSLIPVVAGNRVKTDRRDASRLALLYRAGQLTPIRVPDPHQEALRDLARARADLIDSRTRTRQQLTAMLLRQGLAYPGSTWTGGHAQWLGSLAFDQPALGTAFSHYRSVLALADENVKAIEEDLSPYFDREPYADAIHRLAAYRGISYLGALTLVTEVGDWRRFSAAADFMGFVGLVPSEYSSGGSVRRGRLTKAGNDHLRTQLVESAWSYQHRPGIGPVIGRRHRGLDPATLARSWTAQQRLTRRWRQLAARKHHKGTVAAAIARELAGFCWAEMTADPAPRPWAPSS